MTQVCKGKWNPRPDHLIWHIPTKKPGEFNELAQLETFSSIAVIQLFKKCIVFWQTSSTVKHESKEKIDHISSSFEKSIKTRCTITDLCDCTNCIRRFSTLGDIKYSLYLVQINWEKKRAQFRPFGRPWLTCYVCLDSME